MKTRIVFLGFVIPVVALIAQRQKPPAPQANQYADPALCANCHSGIANTFSRTGMGRSFFRLQPSNTIEDFGKPFYHQPSDSYLVMLQRDGKYYQRRWQLGFDGRETNVDEKQVDYVLGSGNHGRTYLHLTSHNTLQQLPLGWFAEKGGYWAMSPGFDRPDYPGSTRQITYECMFCHNAYPKIPEGHDEVGAKPEFLQPMPESIDCQRCHGPGQRHVDTAGKPGATTTEIRASIVNPKRLSSDRELEVCKQCHLETTSGSLPHDIRKLDRAPFSFIPGQPLGDFRLTFDRAGGMGDKFEIAHAAYRMRESQCYLKSGQKDAEGKLRCTTCHDPHNVPRGEEAVARYNGVCVTCHASAFTKTVAAGRHTSATDCISCHMPKRRAEDAVYMVMTDHLIRSPQPGRDLLAARPETNETPATSYKGKVVLYYPPSVEPSKQTETSLYLAVAQILESSNLAEGLPQLQGLLEKYKPARAEFYADLAEGFSSAGQTAKALPFFEEAVRRAPASTLMLRKLGGAQMEAGQLPQGEATLQRVVAMAPDDAVAETLLGQVLWRRDRIPDAKAAFARGISADPEIPELRDLFGTLLLLNGDAPAAEKEFREALRIQPGFARSQANLASLLAARGDTTEARYHFEQSIRLKPDNAEARLNYARMLVSLHEADAAEKQVQQAVAADARVPAAHALWGELLGTKGDVAGAVRELQAAVQLQPDLWSAQFELGVALGRNRDFVAAEEHLKLAAQGSDPTAKAAAQQLLQRLGR